LHSTAALLAELRRDVGAAAESMLWTSPAGAAARAAADDVVQVLGRLEESFALQAEAVARAGGALDAAQQALATASRLADEHGLTLLEDGTVLPPPPVLMSADASDAERLAVADRLEAARHAKVRAEALARAALAAAGEADRDAAATVRAGDSLGQLLARLVPGSAGLLTCTLPLEAHPRAERERLLAAVDGRDFPSDMAGPAAINAWWQSLPVDVQSGLLAASPEMLGNLDGLPGQVRDRANRARLGRERALLEVEVARLEQRLEDNWFGGGFTDDDAALGYVREKLHALDAIEKVLRRSPTDRHLLLLDPSGEQLTAAVSVGDVDAPTTSRSSRPASPPPCRAAWSATTGSWRRCRGRPRAGRPAPDGHGCHGGLARLRSAAVEHHLAAFAVGGHGRGGRPRRGRLEGFYDGLDAAREVPAHLTPSATRTARWPPAWLSSAVPVSTTSCSSAPPASGPMTWRPGRAAGRVFAVEARNDPVATSRPFGTDVNLLWRRHRPVRRT
jgi:hypothetical protein